MRLLTTEAENVNTDILRDLGSWPDFKHPGWGAAMLADNPSDLS